MSEAGDGHAAAGDAAFASAAAALCPGWRVVDVRTLGADDDVADDTRKSAGYGVPRRVRLRAGDGRERSLVFHTATANPFGHDRRADRAAEQLLAFDTFGRIPRHVRALDVGAIGPRGLVSLGDVGELYLVTEWAEGTPYAADLRRIARSASLAPGDVARCDALAAYLAELHARRDGTAAQYCRAVRDVIGSGEGLFGIRDAYGDDTPGAPAARLDAIEARAVAWRPRLRRASARATTIHGDFHPFNIVFGAGGELQLLDASRGCVGDAADDVAALAINFVFFALDHEDAWRGALGPLWHRFFARYVEASGDDALFEVLAPFVAWRGLVVACPLFYPALPARERERVLTLVERALAASRFDPALADDVMR